MKDQLIQLLKRAPRPDAIASMSQVAEFKRLHKEVAKKLTKKLTEAELISIFNQVKRYY